MRAHRSAGRRDPLAGERVEFAGRRGNMLVGEIHRAGDVCGPALVLCHGMESTRAGRKQTAIVERGLRCGYSVLRFDFSYVGESEGAFEDITVSGEVDDALGALDFLDGFAPQRRILVGSSLGGAVALLAAAQADDRVDAVATIAAVADTALFVDTLTDAELAAWRDTGVRAWREGVVRRTFLDDLENVDVLAAVAASTGPLLVMHGGADEVVPPSHAARIAEAAGSRARIEMFAGVGHRFEEPGALESLLAMLVTWLREDVARERDG